jgi:hypothetical protein
MRSAWRFHAARSIAASSCTRTRFLPWASIDSRRTRLPSSTATSSVKSTPNLMPSSSVIAGMGLSCGTFGSTHSVRCVCRVLAPSACLGAARSLIASATRWTMASMSLTWASSLLPEHQVAASLAPLNIGDRSMPVGVRALAEAITLLVGLLLLMITEA